MNDHKKRKQEAEEARLEAVQHLADPVMGVTPATEVSEPVGTAPPPASQGSGHPVVTRPSFSASVVVEDFREFRSAVLRDERVAECLRIDHDHLNRIIGDNGIKEFPGVKIQEV